MIFDSDTQEGIDNPLIMIGENTKDSVNPPGTIFHLKASEEGEADYQTMTSEEIIEALKTSDKTLNAAKVIIAMIPILYMYPFLQKYFVTSMTLGSVKE